MIQIVPENILRYRKAFIIMLHLKIERRDHAMKYVV